MIELEIFEHMGGEDGTYEDLFYTEIDGDKVLNEDVLHLVLEEMHPKYAEAEYKLEFSSSEEKLEDPDWWDDPSALDVFYDNEEADSD